MQNSRKIQRPSHQEPAVRFEDQSFSENPIAQRLEQLAILRKSCNDFESAARTCEQTRSVWLAFSDTWCLTGGACRDQSTSLIEAFQTTVTVVKKVMKSATEEKAKILAQFLGNINHRVQLVKTMQEKGEQELLKQLRKSA